MSWKSLKLDVSLRNNGLEVAPGEARLISSVTLLAHDPDTPSADVMYIFKSVPTAGLLQLKVGAVLLMFKEMDQIFRGLAH